MTVYEVIPADLMGFGLFNPAFPSVSTLEEAAMLIKGPADCILAIENGNRRGLTETEADALLALQRASKP